MCCRKPCSVFCFIPAIYHLILSHSTDAPLSCVLLSSTSPALVLLTAILAPRALTSPIDLFLPPATTRRCGQHKQHNCKRSRITSFSSNPSSSSLSQQVWCFLGLNKKALVLTKNMTLLPMKTQVYCQQKRIFYFINLLSLAKPHLNGSLIFTWPKQSYRTKWNSIQWKPCVTYSIALNIFGE
jgi:hypothetical protein